MTPRRRPFLLLLPVLGLLAAACGSDDSTTNTTTAEGDRSVSDTSGAAVDTTAGSGLGYVIVDTNQGTCYDTSELIDCPTGGEAFYGQDAQYTGNTPSYTDNGAAR